MAKKTKECAERTRLQLLQAATGLFLTQGYSKTTMEQIATHAGFSRGAVHWHFKNKMEIFVAMKDRVSQPLIAQMDEILLAHPTMDQMDAIGESIRAFFHSLAQDGEVRDTFIVMKRRFGYTDEYEDLHAEMKKPERDCQKKLSDAFERSQELGLLRRDLSPYLASEITQSFIVGVMNRWLDDQNNLSLLNDQSKTIEALIRVMRT